MCVLIKIIFDEQDFKTSYFIYQCVSEDQGAFKVL